MLYLTGVTNDEDEPVLIMRKIGLMSQPGNSYWKRAHRYPFHAADNACYRDKWVEGVWLDWLAVKVPRERCLFAVAPDVYPDALGSLERGRQYFQLIRDLGFPVAVVAQDGAEELDYPWDEFDCLFIGGERTANPKLEWKTSRAAEELCNRARNHGKWVHMGRVNSLERLIRAREMGCNSVDGTFLKYRRRKQARDDKDRGVMELSWWMYWLDKNPSEKVFEVPSLEIHRRAAK